MKIWTSNYNRTNNTLTTLIPVRISKSVPSWYGFATEPLSLLYPTWDMINEYKEGLISEEEYTERYYALLNERTTPEEVLQRIHDISKANWGRNVVLLCHCGGFCHRHLIQDWIGVEIKELNN